MGKDGVLTRCEATETAEVLVLFVLLPGPSFQSPFPVAPLLRKWVGPIAELDVSLSAKNC